MKFITIRFMTKKLLIAISILLFLGCSDHNKDLYQDVSIELLETIEVDYQGVLTLVDFNSEKGFLLAVDQNPLNNVILLLNLKGEILSKFDNRIPGENNFKGKLNSISFDKNGEGYWIVSYSGLYKYNSDWKLIDFYENHDSNGSKYWNTDLKHFFVTNKSDTSQFYLYTLLNAEKTNLNNENPNYYKQVKHLTSFDSKNREFKLDAGFEKNSIYLNNEFRFPPYFVFFEKSSDDQSIILSYSHEPSIYTYKIGENGQLKFFERIGLDLDYFDISVKTPFGSEIDFNKSSFDSRITSILNHKEYTYVTYLKSINQNDFFSSGNSFDNQAQFENYLMKNYHYVLHVLKDGKKYCNDIILPQHLYNPIVALSEDTLIFQPSRAFFEKENETFFVLKLKF